MLACVSIDFMVPEATHADLLAGSYAFGGVFRYDDDGNSIAGGIGFGSAGLAFAGGMTVGPDGNIYVSSQGTGEILFYDGATGTPLASPHAGSRDGLFATLANAGDPPVGGPGPLRFGPDGKLYVSDFGGQSVRVFDGNTGSEETVAATLATGPPGGIAFGPDGALYVGDFGSASVFRFENGTGNFYVTPQSGGLLTASSLLFLPDGHLLVADLYGNHLLEYDENGQNPSVFATIPPMNTPTAENPTGTNFPSDLAFDADGNLVLAVLGATNPPDNRGQILRFDLDGNPLGDPPGTPVVDMQPTLSSIAWIKSADAIVGDYDGDGNVDDVDYAKWKADFGKRVAVGGGADGNGNGIVDAGDYTVWRDALSGVVVGSASGVAVPEPASIALVIFGVAFTLGMRGRSNLYYRTGGQSS